MPMIEKHFIYMQRSKKSRKHYKWSYESGPASWASHLLLMSSSHPAAAAATKWCQSCLTLCDPIDGNPPGSPVPGILQARTLEWVVISFSNAWKWKVKVKSLSHVQLLVTPWTAAYQAPPSMGFFQARALEWGAIAFSTSHPSIVQFPLFEHCIKVSSGQQCSL